PPAFPSAPTRRSSDLLEDAVAAHLDGRERLAEPDHNAGNPAVAHDQVRSEAERHHRRAFLERGKERDEVIEVGRLEQPVGRAAALEPDQLVERCIARQLAAHVGRHPPGETGFLFRARSVPGAVPRSDLIGHANPWAALRNGFPRRAATSLARFAAHVVMSPAPRQTTMSPGASNPAIRSATSSGPSMRAAARWPRSLRPSTSASASTPGMGCSPAG